MDIIFVFYLTAQVTQWGLIMHGTDAPAQPNDPPNFEPPQAEPDFFGHIDQNSLDFDAQTSGQWRHMQQVRYFNTKTNNYRFYYNNLLID